MSLTSYRAALPRSLFLGKRWAKISDSAGETRTNFTFFLPSDFGGTGWRRTGVGGRLKRTLFFPLAGWCGGCFQRAGGREIRGDCLLTEEGWGSSFRGLLKVSDSGTRSGRCPLFSTLRASCLKLEMGVQGEEEV